MGNRLAQDQRREEAEELLLSLVEREPQPDWFVREAARNAGLTYADMVEAMNRLGATRVPDDEGFLWALSHNGR